MKKKVLFIIWSFTAGGGAEKILANIVNNLDSEKYEIDVWEYQRFNISKEEIASSIRLISPAIYEIDINENILKNTLKRVNNKVINKIMNTDPRLLRKIFLKNKYDIEVAFNYQIPTFLLTTNKNKKKFAWIHSSIEDLDYRKYNENDNNRVRKQYDMQKVAFSNCDKVIAISKVTEESILSLYPEQKDKIVRIYNGYDFEKIYKKSNLFRVDKSEKFRLVAIGRLCKQKNFKLLLEAVSVLVNYSIDFELLILGEGPERNYLEKYINEKSLNNYVKLLGFIENPYPYIKSSDLMCLSSIAEGFPTVLVESMALGVPFISTDVAGADELSCNGSCGVISLYEPQIYAEDIIKLINKPEEVNKMSLMCKEEILRYTLQNQIKNIEELFDN